ncbi:MAG: hypothetical protein M0Z84_05950 [Gammaproteobacteria bacterium]|nr:hypothetical protein [Gammaproteobacteria bacterium]
MYRLTSGITDTEDCNVCRGLSLYPGTAMRHRQDDPGLCQFKLELRTFGCVL